MERKIGEIFEYNGGWYQAVKQTEKSCKACYFYSDEGCFVSTGLGWCRHYSRNDNKSVIFKKLEKVGEPYTTFADKTLQNYLLETAVTVPPKDVIVLINNEQRLIAIEIKQTKEDMEENKLNLKPFDIQKAREGKPVCTRDGRNVRIIAFDAKRKDEKNIIALVPSKDYPGFEDLIAYPNNGNYYGGHENDGDLMMLPEKKEGWVNVYREESNNNERLIEQTIYKTRQDAFEKACPQGYITTTKINWEE